MKNPNFRLEGVVKGKNELQDFEGPLSLILMLLSKNKIEIRDISISDILDQYLEYLDQMQSMDLEIASEFVQMASHLLYIKTKTLLVNDEEEVSELEVLMASLEQLKCKDLLASIQQVLPEMQDAAEKGMLYYSKMPEPLRREDRQYEYKHEPVELLRAMYSMYSRGSRPTEKEENLLSAVPKRIIYSVKDKSREILLRLGKKAETLNEIYSECSSRSELVASFVAVLELCSMGSIKISRLEGDYQLEFVGGDMDEILENISE